jgi:hypothetical protein
MMPKSGIGELKVVLTALCGTSSSLRDHKVAAITYFIKPRISVRTEHLPNEKLKILTYFRE